MKTRSKVKILILLAVLIVVALIAISVFQLVKIIQTQNKITSQEQQIEQLEKELDYYKNKAN